MKWLGDVIIMLSALFALFYGIYNLVEKKIALFFQMIVASIGCLILGYGFDICELLTRGANSEGFTIGYLGYIGNFLFLLTANYAYMDGILDDGTAEAKKARRIALLAPVVTVLLFVPNLLADVPMGTKITYALTWLPAIFSTYYNFKHMLLPDMGFGFVRSIRPFNFAALLFSMFHLLHLTLWNYDSWVALLISGILVGASVIAMTFLAKRGVKRWII